MKVTARKADLYDIDGTNWPKLSETSSIHSCINYKPMPKPKFDFQIKTGFRIVQHLLFTWVAVWEFLREDN